MGIGVGLAAGLFLILALLFGLNGVAWLLWYDLPTGHGLNYFYGYFVLAIVLVVLGSLAGFIAYRVLSRSSPPTPSMAIDEARKIRDTVESHAEGAR